VKKDTQPGLGKEAAGPRVTASGPMTCPPPSETGAKRRPSRLLGRPSGTLKRHASAPTSIDTDDLAVSVRVTASTKPRMQRGADIAKAPLDPREAFVLSRVDGELTIEDIADLVGLGMKDALGIVRKLARLGLVAV
jgi:hypothetical protein